MTIDEKWLPVETVENLVQTHTNKVANAYQYNEIDMLFSDNSLYTSYFENDNFIRNTNINATYLSEEQKIHIVNTDYDNNRELTKNIYTCRITNQYGNIDKYMSETNYNYAANYFKFVVDYEQFEDTICIPELIVFNSSTRRTTSITGITNIMNLDKNTNYVSAIYLHVREKNLSNTYSNASFNLGYKLDDYFFTAGFGTPEVRFNFLDFRIYEVTNSHVNFSYHLKQEGIKFDVNTPIDNLTIIDDIPVVRLRASSDTDIIRLLLTIDDVIKYLAFCNVCYVDNNDYNIKYVSECKNGKLTGNLLQYTEWKNSDNSNNNSYEDTPEPVLDEDEKDNVANMDLSYLLVQNTAPFSRYYICTSQQLASLSVNISTSETIPEGLNVFDNIVFLQCYPVDLLDRFITNNSEIIIANWASGVNALRTTSQITVSPAYYIDIVRHYNDFRDFAPVSKYELYLPLYGMYQLPDFVAGCSVKIQILYDIISCELIYHISVSDRQKQNYTLIDKIKCVCGTSISFKAENNSMKLLENRQNILNTINSATAFVSSLATKNVAGTISATTSIANSFTNDAIINNKSRTQAIGQNTSVASFNDVSAIYLYITRTETKIPNNFAKVIGHLYDNNDKLENHVGLCICNNVNLDNINCTFTEKEMIKNILESYFYI